MCAWCPVDIIVAPRYSFSMKRWTEYEVEYMLAVQDLIPIAAIARALGRTKRAVEDYRLRNGIRMSPKARSLRQADGAQTARDAANGMYGENNPNWKGGRSKDNYYYKLRQIERYPERVKARDILKREIRSGRMKRGLCEVCGDQNGQAHHDDYSKPLDVIWLCRKHHRERHRS